MVRPHRLRIPCALTVALLGALTLSCGDEIVMTATTPTTLNPVPRLFAMSPRFAVEDGGAFPLLIVGEDFVPGATFYWNGFERATEYVSPTEVRATILATDVAALPGSSSDQTVSVWVRNPEPGGGTSGAVPFWVLKPRPVPAIASISPESSPVGEPDVILDVVGTGFHEETVARWGPIHTALLTTYDSPTHLTVLLPKKYFRSPKTMDISVFNPSPDGGGSNVVFFVVGPPNPVR